MTLKKNPKLNISKKAPLESIFSTRRQSAELLTNFISTITQPYTLAINSSWGTGKTTFLEAWKQHLELNSDSYKVAYFNAWESDYSENAFVTIISEITSQLFPKKKKLINAAVNVAEIALPIAMKALTANVLDIEGIKRGAESFGDISKDLFSAAINNHKKTKKQLEFFKSELTNINKTESPDKPIVIIIDELDRCKPSYSIEVLECIKHLFSIEGYVFVLAIDKKELSSSIKHEYGEVDTDGYLRRFIDLTYDLPDPSNEEFVNHLSIVFDLKSQSQNQNIDDFNLYLMHIADSVTLSLREVEQIYAEYNAIIRTYPKAADFSIFICVALVIKSKEHTYYKEIINGISSLDLKKSGIINARKYQEDNYDYIFELLNAVAKAVTDRNHSLISGNVIKDPSILKKRKLVNIILNVPGFSETDQNTRMIELINKWVEFGQRFSK
jgi:hypothetical protein